LFNAIKWKSIILDNNGNVLGVIFLETYKKKREEFIITLLFGWLGVHRFMKNEILLGFIYWITVGVFGICWIIDTIKVGVELHNLKRESSINNKSNLSNNSEEKEDKNYLLYKSLSTDIINMSSEIERMFENGILNEINYLKLFDIIKNYKDKAEDISIKSKSVYNQEYSEVLEKMIRGFHNIVNNLFVIFHNASMNQLLGYDYEQSKDGVQQHLKRITEMKEKDKDSDINLYNILYNDTQSVINNFDIIHYNYNHSISIEKDCNFENAEVTTASHDYGVDVIAYKDNIKYAIQCKKYSSKVGIKAVQEVIGSRSMHKCHVGVVLTNNYFTKSAIELAEKNNIFLWDRNKLDELLKKYQEKDVELL